MRESERDGWTKNAVEIVKQIQRILEFSKHSSLEYPGNIIDS
jgi:hypothetical protein